jgi:hypothetical protein
MSGAGEDFLLARWGGVSFPAFLSPESSLVMFGTGPGAAITAATKGAGKIESVLGSSVSISVLALAPGASTSGSGMSFGIPLLSISISTSTRLSCVSAARSCIRCESTISHMDLSASNSEAGLRRKSELRGRNILVGLPVVDIMACFVSGRPVTVWPDGVVNFRWRVTPSARYASMLRSWRMMSSLLDVPRGMRLQ